MVGIERVQLAVAVPPLNTRPPPVASIDPQLGDFGKLCFHASMPVSTFHACTSPKWSAPGAIDEPKPDTPPKLRPGL